jgi:hypothetical protein
MSAESSHAPSVARHLARGAIGFGLIGAALVLATSIGPFALLLAPGGMVALRGCPTCWVLGLVEAISAGRLQRTCAENGCTLRPPASTPGPDVDSWESGAVPADRQTLLRRQARWSQSP